MAQEAGRAALVLTGGGARAAYQVGVLQALRHIRGPRPGNPFPILCGTSAGGINAAALAVYSADFNMAVRKVAWIWRNFHVDQVYRADAPALIGSGLRWGSALMTGWAVRQTPRALLDNSPLRRLLLHTLDFSAIDRAIAAGHLHALSVTASGYTSGESLAFFAAHPSVPNWRRTQRLGVRATIGVDHLLASSAIPFVFPAVRINREYFGDGSMRQLAPVSPAIHLGADRILVIGAGRLAEEGRQRTDAYPSPAQIAGHAMSSIFLDGLAVDLERMERINATLNAFSEAQRQAAGVPLRPIETLVISPSQRLDTMAGHHRESLPTMLRLVLRGVGAMRREGSTLLSYLLFEPGFTRALMELGFEDTMARRDEVVAFLRL
ncbi:patatin-like phospholipase family protein [Parazoarcus communis]|uniref:Patatin-like phospholipase family protein n=1 Tax=Parazoarcus communis SWub3 = DSM 12120 TaxID=1121029 RepID=A0A323V052_9RHOO|nr:patatin-like phospholipase family protein [Parazoarcus communis]NMG71713.1 patatin-like phospholipase family protein [Parazoarcus communis SWub3 = DSM 12120]PZA17340.1 patatin-like phospholipase family protein [Azoarcus communis] [Parazoarcus communis SWub3 = DSM 12120]